MNLTQTSRPHSAPVVPRRFAAWLATLVMLLGLVFIALERDALRRAISEASWGPLPLALATTALSYLCISLSFARVCRLLRVEMSTRDLMGVGFISVVLNHLVASGGAAGYSVRYALMSRHGVSFSRTLAVSILHFVLISLVMIGMLPVGVVYLVTHAAISAGVARLLTTGALLLIVGDGLLIGLVASSPLRSRVFAALEAAARSILKREIGEKLAPVDAALLEGTRALRRRPIELVRLYLLFGIDWAASAATLWLSFRALGVSLAPGALISGFVIGLVTGVASIVPGGLGVQEGTMAGIFSLLGVDFERAVLAAVSYRAVFFIVPYLISLGLYQRLLRQDRRLAQRVEIEGGHAHLDA